ncbi:MAG: hypothetical protein EBZ77_03720, partial [Chitinophagia bacterium]|nr:hypothetical protein [Chitinophagia bacterium]
TSPTINGTAGAIGSLPAARRYEPILTTASYAWTPSSGLSSSTSGSPVVTVTSAGTYSVVVTDTTSGCNATATVNVATYATPTVTVSPAVVCVGTPMTASGASTYSWAPSTGLSATTGATSTASSYTVTVYTVTGISVNGCVDTLIQNISVPTASVSPSSTIYCSGFSPVSLSGVGTSTNYSWSPAFGLTATTGTTVGASPSVTTTYTVVGTNASGCTSAPTTATVTFNHTPTTITGSSSTLCTPGTMLLATDGTSGAWSASDTSVASVDATGLVTAISAGTVNISYTNATCGFATYPLTVATGGFTVTTSPSSGTYCASGSPLSITASDGGAGAAFTWSPATGLSATTGATVAASPTVTTSYTVTASTGACSNSAVIVVTNNTPVAIVGVDSICVGSTSTFTNATGSGTWSSSAPSIASVNASTGAVRGVAAGSANITFTVTASGCYVTKSIRVDTTPVLTFTPASALACGGIGVLVTASGANTYSWTPATGLSATTGAAVTANPGATTTYSITGVNRYGCSSVGTKTVAVGSTAMLAYASASPATVCAGSNTTLTGAPAASTVYSRSSITYSAASTTGFSSGPTGDDVNSGAISLPFTFNYFGVNYSNIYICTNGWVSFTSTSTNLANYTLPNTTAAGTMGPLIALGMHDMNTGGGSITYGTIGTAPNRVFVISYNSYGDFSCGGTNTGQIKLYESSNVVDVLVNNLSGTCLNTVGIQNASGTTAYTFTSPTINGTTGPISSGLPAAVRYTPSFPTATYAWAPAAGVTSTTASSTTATVSTTTVYTLTVTDPASGCYGVTTRTVTANPLPVISVSPTTVCRNVTATASGAATYSWSPASGLSATAGSSVVPNPSSPTVYTVTGVDTNGCAGIATMNISWPTVSTASSSVFYCSSGSAPTLSASGSGVSYAWLPTAGLSAATSASTTASPTVTTVYTVTASDAAGCTNTAVDTVVYNAATAAISGPSSSICLPGTMILTETGTGGSWSSSDTTLGVVNASGIVTGITAGSYTITYDNPACGGSATYALTNVPGGFTVSVSPSSGSYCSTGSALSLTASGATTYVWLPTTGLSSGTGTTVNASPSVTTTYTVTGTTSGCSNSATVTVTNSTPTAIYGGVTTVCVGSNTTWSDSTVGGSWSSSNTSIATVSSGGVITGTGAGSATITYNVSGCYVTRSITVNALPVLSFTPSTAALCGTGSTSISITASGASTYSWSPATFLSTTAAATVVVTPTVAITYTVVGTSSAGCVATATKSVAYGTAVSAYATTNPSVVCSGGVVNLSGQAASGTAYTQSTITYSAAATTGFSAGPTGDDVNSGAIALPFTFNYFGINYSNIYICTNGWVSFTSTSTNLGNYVLPSTAAAGVMGPLIAMGMHDMNTGGGNISYGVIGSAPNRVFVVSYNNYGDFSCGGTNAGQIKLYESSNMIDVLVSSLSGTCSNTVGIQNASGTVAYTFTSPTINGTTGAIGSLPAARRYVPSLPSARYAWLPSSGVTTSAAATTTATLTATTTYTLTVTDSTSGCAGSFNVTDTAVAAPVVTMASSLSDFCSGGRDSLSAVSTGGVGAITGYSWSGPGIATTTGTLPYANINPTVAATTTGAYSVTVTYAVSGCGPITASTSTITLNSDPVVTVTPSSTSLCPSDTLTLTEALVSGG